MRILFSHRIQSRDGQSVHVEELVAAFRAAGHDVLMVGPAAYGQAAFGGESGVIARVRRLLPPAVGELAELAYNVPAYLRLRRAWRAFRPDLIYERYNLYFLAGGWLARRHGVPLYQEVNAPLAEERARFGNLRLARLARRLERWTWNSATRVLAVTGVLRDMIVAAGVDARRVEVIPNGVVLDRYDAIARPAHPAPLVLGFVGFVRSWHGLDTVIAAMAAQPDAAGLVLTIVGEGPARADLEAKAAALGITSRVRFTGLVEHARIAEAVSGFDIALQPKVVPYASPLKVFDYMAAGRAIVAPDQPNIREVLTHEQTALLFDPTDAGAMWRAIARLIADADLRRLLGAAARADLERADRTWAGNARRIAAAAAADIAARTPTRAQPGAHTDTASAAVQRHQV